MGKIKLRLLYLVIFLNFTQGMWERIFFFSSSGVQNILDILICTFIIFRFKYNLKAPGSTAFIFLCGISMFVGYANNEPLIESFLYLRFVIYTYLIYNQLYSNPLTENKWSTILKLVIAMIVLQGVGALFNIFILGERVERYVGVMSTSGGTTATIFPMLITNILLIYYLFSSKLTRKKILLMGGMLFGVFLVGYSSGKRAIYFAIPAISLITFLLALTKLVNQKYFKKKIIGLSWVGLIIFPLIIFGITNSEGINSGLSGNETSVEVISNAIEFAEHYESNTDQYGNTGGRSNTRSLVVDNALSNLDFLFFGEGYGSIKDEDTRFRLGFVYGIVGVSRDIISGGFFLAFITIFLYLRIILVNNSIKTKITTVFRQIILILFIFTHIFYSSDFVVSLNITLLIIILLALINSPHHKKTLTLLLQKNKLFK